MANPFEDPDVRAASANNEEAAYNNTPPNQNSAYDEPQEYHPTDNTNDNIQQSNNNDRTTNINANVNAAAVNAAQYVPKDVVQNVAMSTGKQMAKETGQQLQNEYKQDMANQSNQNQAPPPPDWFTRMFYWFPIRYFAFVAGMAMFSIPIVDMATSDLQFLTFFIYLYLMAFGVMVMFVESPSWRGTRWMQLKIFFWFRFLSRLWGRSWFYLFVSILCYTEIKDQFTGTFIVGMYLTTLGLIGFVYSRISAKKYVRIFVFVASGSEGDELERKLQAKFDELDKDQDGRIGSSEIVYLARQAGRELANSERHTIQTFLDESCYGAVSKDDWMRQFLGRQMNQRFL